MNGEIKKINLGKLIAAAIVVTVVGTIIGILTCGWLFNWVYQIPPTEVWKYTEDVSSSAMIFSIIGEFILTLILVWVYAILYEGIPYQGWKKGMKFGFLVWLVATLPGMFATYMWMNVAVEWIIYMVIMGLIVYLIKGAIIGVIYKK